MTHIAKAFGSVAIMILVGCAEIPDHEDEAEKSTHGEDSVSEPIDDQASDTVAPVVEVTDEAARASIDAGNLIVLQYPPLPSPPGHNEYVRLLWERYGISFQNVEPPPGVDKKSFSKHVRSWTKLTKAEARRQFGDDIFGKARAEANAEWEMGRPSD